MYVPNDDQNASPTSWYQQYEYDSLNRLTQVHEHASNADLLWRQQFVYDRWGNRTIDYYNTSSNIPRSQFTVSTTNNRLGVPSGQTGTMTYDSAGNLTTDTYSAAAVTRVYDAENRMTSETQANSYAAGTYSYDGDGRRVKRVVGSVETWQVYGLGGELLAEYAANADHLSPQKEYGYRNGQLLITATVTSGWGAAPTLHDNPLVVNETTVQARHITELHEAINALRSHLNMAPYSWQYSVATNDWITANPILEMRTALDQALGAPSGGYSAGLAQYQEVKAIHIQELRDRVLAAWNTSSSTQINWLVTDQLGTPRIIFDQTGSLANVSRHDYLPFGEELFAAQGGRTPQQGYTLSDNVRQKFTQKERDIETGLDYFLARYYSSTQGRFTSPDEFAGGPHEIFEAVLDPTPLLYAEPTEPQSLNKYNYCLGNPLRYLDPDGHQTKQADALIIVTPRTAILVGNVAVGVLKEVGNIGIGMNNVSADFGIPGTRQIESHRASNMTQAMAMVVTRDLSIFGGFLTGKPQAGVMMEEAEAPAVIASEVGNASAETRGVDAIAESSNAARREAMRQGGLPTSQQPRSQVRSPHGNSYEYDVNMPGGGRTTGVVTNDPRPMSAHNPHGPHWEAGAAKSPARRDPAERLRMQNKNKVRVAY